MATIGSRKMKCTTLMELRTAFENLYKKEPLLNIACYGPNAERAAASWDYQASGFQNGSPEDYRSLVILSAKQAGYEGDQGGAWVWFHERLKEHLLKNKSRRIHTGTHR